MSIIQRRRPGDVPVNRRSWQAQAKIAVGIVVLVVSLAVSSPPALAATSHAQPPPGMSPVNPAPSGYFEYSLKPGQSISGTVVLHDTADTSARYLVYVTGTNTSPTTGVAYGQHLFHQLGSARWVRLTSGVVAVKAHGRTADHFVVSVPNGTPPGDYVIGIAAQSPGHAISTGTTGKTVGVRLVTTTRTIIAVVVSTPGPNVDTFRFGAPSVTLQQHRRQVLIIPIADTGNRLTKPYLSGDLTRCSGGPPVLRIARQLDTFVPRTHIDYPWYLNNQVLPAGCYRATFALSVGGTRVATYDGTFRVGVPATKIVRPAPAGTQVVVRNVVPTWLIATVASLAALLALILVALWRSRRAKRRKPSTPIPFPSLRPRRSRPQHATRSRHSTS